LIPNPNPNLNPITDPNPNPKNKRKQNYLNKVQHRIYIQRLIS